MSLLRFTPGDCNPPGCGPPARFGGMRCAADSHEFASIGYATANSAAFRILLWLAVRSSHPTGAWESWCDSLCRHTLPSALLASGPQVRFGLASGCDSATFSPSRTAARLYRGLAALSFTLWP